MKVNFVTLLNSIVICFAFSASAQLSNNLNSGIWQAFSDPLSSTQYPQIEGRLCNFKWKDIETSSNVWKWTDFDKALTDRTKDGLPVIFLVYTKEDAPDWLFTTGGVSKVTEKDSKGTVTGYAPYYKDANYKSYFKRMVQKVHQHIETLPASVRKGIIGVQACFGSTGDYISYKGTVDSKYTLTGADFSNLFREFTQYYYDEYKNTNPKITLLSNPRNNGKDDALWLVQNCPGGWIKSSSLGKAFQLNGERDKASWLYNILNSPQSGSYVLCRSEMVDGGISAKWWKNAPYQNMFALLCYGVHWGLDWSNQRSEELKDKLYYDAFNFFNKYAGQKNPAKSANAMCALKDALDASDAVRFPASKYGTVSQTNKQRYQNIANDFAAYGAKLEDPKTATSTEMDNIQAKGINDVGWNLLTGNYERYLHQLNANETSIGYWNVKSADKNAMYGKYARSFDVSANKKALYFDVDNAFLGNAALNGKYAVTIDVTYLDNGGGSFQLFYDAKGNTDKASISVKCGNTNTWKKASVTLQDANFANKGASKSDFSIRSTNNKNVIFAVVELSRPASFASLASESSSSALVANEQLLTNKENLLLKNNLLISPNPVVQDFYVQLKDNKVITDVAIYNQSGKLLLQKKTSGTKIPFSKAAIGNSAGAYYIKVFSGNTSYTGKIIVL